MKMWRERYYRLGGHLFYIEKFRDENNGSYKLQIDGREASKEEVREFERLLDDFNKF
jgi:hypothetical protein